MTSFGLNALTSAIRHFNEGELGPAEDCAWSVLGEEPNHAEALHLVGLIAHKKGLADQALDYLNRSLLCDGANPLTWCHLGDTRLATGEYEAAIANYQRALELRPDFGEAHNNLGFAWLSLEQWDNAAAAFQRAAELMPNFAPAHNNLGVALKHLGKLKEAEATFERALALQPDNADHAYNLGVVVNNLGELDRAAALYRRVLSLQPGHLNGANNLATVLKEQGNFAEAIGIFQDILRRQPDFVLAYYSLSEFVAEGRYAFSPAELERIRALTASERCSSTDRSLACFAVATALNRQGSYDEAFGHYRQANAHRKNLGARGKAAYDPAVHAAYVERLMAAQDRAYFARARGWGSKSNLPIFIIGMPRSGSTLVEQILASHPQVFGAGELGEVPEFFVNRLASAPGGMLTPPDAAAAHQLAEEFLDQARRLAGGAARVAIKNLDNDTHLGAIAACLPGARVVYCRRDPLDLCLSCFFQNFSNVNFAWSLEDIGACYQTHVRLMAHWSRVLPLAIHEVSYEDLVHHQEAVTRRLLAFCGLDWDERCLAFYKTPRTVRTASCIQVRRPISKRSIGRWQNYRAHLGPLFKALGMEEPRKSTAPSSAAPLLGAALPAVPAQPAEHRYGGREADCE